MVKHSKQRPKWPLISSIVVIAIIVVVILVNKQGGDVSSFKIQSPIKNCYMVAEQYTEQEAYRYEFKYDVISSELKDGMEGFLNHVTRGIVNVRNLEDKTGSFTVEYTFTTLDGSEKGSNTEYIMSGETKEFIATYDSKLTQDVKGSYRVISPSETRYRTVTKTRQVEKCD